MSEISKMIILIERLFWWDYYSGMIPSYRAGKYLPLETIDDLVFQFNYVGFNDLCIYPKTKDMARYKDSSRKYTKGIDSVYYGHTNTNQIGK